MEYRLPHTQQTAHACLRRNLGEAIINSEIITEVYTNICASINTSNVRRGRFYPLLFVQWHGRTYPFTDSTNLIDSRRKECARANWILDKQIQFSLLLSYHFFELHIWLKQITGNEEKKTQHFEIFLSGQSNLRALRSTSIAGNRQQLNKIFVCSCRSSANEHF